MKRVLPFCLLLVLCLTSSCGDEEVLGPETGDVRVELRPDSTDLHHNESVQFHAHVTGAADTTVTWKVAGRTHGDSLIGTITATGLYTAPARIPETITPIVVIVTAASRLAPSQSDSAEVTLVSGEEGVCIEISPFESTVGLGERVVFGSGIENASDLTLDWSVDVIPGISDVGAMESPGVYNAPEVLADSLTVTVRATSVEDASRSAAVLIHVVPSHLVTVEMDPVTATIETNRSLWLQARVLGCADTSVIWTVNGRAGGDSLNGIVSPTGRYTAPAHVPAPSPITIRATSAVQPKRYAETLVDIEAATAGSSIVLFPTEIRVGFGDLQQFEAEVNKTAVDVYWSVDEIPGIPDVGSFFALPAGAYHAPASVPGESVTVVVRATSTWDPEISAAALVYLYEPPVVDIASETASLNVGLGQQFSVTVANADDPTVTWRVDGVEGGDPTHGTITSDGYYVAPEAVPSPGQVSVEAVLSADPRRKDTVRVMILPAIEVHLSPAHAAIGLTQDLYFDCRVENTTDTGLDWYVNGDPGGSTSLGYMNASGKYHAPETLPDPPRVEVKAVSRKDPSRFAAATVEIVAPVTFETESYIASDDRGGLPVYVVPRSGASAGVAVEGLDRVAEWIDIPIQLDYSGSYVISFRHASDEDVTVILSIPGSGPKGQDGEWILGLNGGGCG